VNKLNMWLKSLAKVSPESEELLEELLGFVEDVERYGVNDGLLRREDGTIVELLNWWADRTTLPAILHLMTFHGEGETWRRLRRNVEVEMFIEFFHLPLYWAGYGFPLLRRDPKFKRLCRKSINLL